MDPVIVGVMGSLNEDSLGMVAALYNISFSAGFALGPLLGGFLYDFGGFYLPFLVTGL